MTRQESGIGLAARAVGTAALLLAGGCAPGQDARTPEPGPVSATQGTELALAWRPDARPCQQYASFDVPGGADTEGFGVNDLGQIVGRWTDADGNVHGFLRQPTGRYETIDAPGATFTAPVDINNLGTVVGRYLDADGVSHGFALRQGRYQTIDAPGAADTRPRGIDDQGRITGDFRRDDGVEHGFTIDARGFAQVDVPGSATTDVWDINDLGIRVGDWSDDEGNVHGYVLRAGSFSTFDYPGVRFATSARRINLWGAIVGEFTESETTGDHGFLREGDHFRQIDFPGAAETDAMAINLWGLIVGNFLDSDGAEHGFVLKDCHAD